MVQKPFLTTDVLPICHIYLIGMQT